MADVKLVKNWITAAGYRAAILYVNGHNNGYVALPPTHPLFGVDYDTAALCLSFPANEPLSKRSPLALMCCNAEARPSVVFDVHGGITYSDYKLAQVSVLEEEQLWWYGFDTAHYGDANSPEYYAKLKEQYPDMPFMWAADGEYRTVEYVTAECESLAAQLNTRVNYHLRG
jgi:hypothetical protein